MLQFDQVSLSFDNGRSWALQSFSCCLPPQQTLVLLGSSGSGKTTLLKCVNRLLTPSRGSVCWQGTDVARLEVIALRRRIGYVFQGIGLFPHFTVAQNIGVVPGLLGWTQAETQARVEELLELVGMPAREYARRFPHQLSGGQQQRVGVARALAARPELLLLDEPFSALDSMSRDGLQELLLELKGRLSLVLVTHDVAEALRLADVLGVMHQGRLQQVGSPSVLLANPATSFVRELLYKPLAGWQRWKATV